ncbi:M12 family metallo-peptidase [Pseudomonas mucidolens]|uniref:Metallo-peptidase family M12B Reprolysin-like n=1 Tax=Pseudomonas mucidolens TaxID=46679 RepID=A0A1H2NVI8_9PSED|nr:M12 family metallo-peptidase [Pseudomonas mucidolens]SDV09115.1 hypothetical protein SAMN05216202_4724 [Pseudomonas mucidolens]SQH37476.1 Uncharacterised protein [Pseudomonas mucidolens]
MRPINLNTFIHDSVSDTNYQHLKTRQLDHFVEELANVSGRQVNICFHEYVPGVTNFDYQGPNAGAKVNEWNGVANQYAEKIGITPTQTDRNVLVIDGFITGQVAGVAQTAGKTGNSLIASTIDATTLAHEVGHTFNAKHTGVMQVPDPDNPGHFRSSYMATGKDVGTGNLLRYSTINRERIQDFLKNLA